MSHSSTTHSSEFSGFPSHEVMKEGRPQDEHPILQDLRKLIVRCTQELLEMGEPEDEVRDSERFALDAIDTVSAEFQRRDSHLHSIDEHLKEMGEVPLNKPGWREKTRPFLVKIQECVEQLPEGSERECLLTCLAEAWRFNKGSDQLPFRAPKERGKK